MPIIPLTSHLKSLGRIYIFAEDIIRLLSSGSIRKALLAPKVQTFDEILKEFNIEIEGLPQELKEKIIGIVEEQKRLIEEYPLTIINQSLQIACSLFETFLIESLETIFDTKKQTVINLSEQKNIKLEEIIELGDYDKIFSSFKDKILRNFSRASTKEQFEKYFCGLGFKIQEVFHMSNYKAEVQRTYEGWELEKLISIFDERHRIVHNGESPLNSLKDLYLRKEFFIKLIMNISIEIYNKFNIPNDLSLPLTLQKETS